MSLRLVLADDHQILRDSLKRAFEAAGETVVGEASNGEEAIAMVASLQPDVILMDLTMPVLDGASATKRISDEYPDTKVVILTMHDDVSHTQSALAAGAMGFLTKGSSFADVHRTIKAAGKGLTTLSPELADSIMAAAAGEVDEEGEEVLSSRQVEILQLIADGMTTKQAARELGIAQKTIHNHLNAVYRKLDTQSLTHAVLSAVRLGIIELN